jgi:hypothetical protein
MKFNESNLRRIGDGWADEADGIAFLEEVSAVGRQRHVRRIVHLQPGVDFTNQVSYVIHEQNLIAVCN